MDGTLSSFSRALNRVTKEFVETNRVVLASSSYSARDIYKYLKDDEATRSVTLVEAFRSGYLVFASLHHAPSVQGFLEKGTRYIVLDMDSTIFPIIVYNPYERESGEPYVLFDWNSGNNTGYRAEKRINLKFSDISIVSDVPGLFAITAESHLSKLRSCIRDKVPASLQHNGTMSYILSKKHFPLLLVGLTDKAFAIRYAVNTEPLGSWSWSQSISAVSISINGTLNQAHDVEEINFPVLALRDLGIAKLMYHPGNPRLHISELSMSLPTILADKITALRTVYSTKLHKNTLEEDEFNSLLQTQVRLTSSGEAELLLPPDKELGKKVTNFLVRKMRSDNFGAEEKELVSKLTGRSITPQRNYKKTVLNESNDLVEAIMSNRGKVIRYEIKEREPDTSTVPSKLYSLFDRLPMRLYNAGFMETETPVVVQLTYHRLTPSWYMKDERVTIRISITPANNRLYFNTIATSKEKPALENITGKGAPFLVVRPVCKGTLFSFSAPELVSNFKNNLQKSISENSSTFVRTRLIPSLARVITTSFLGLHNKYLPVKVTAGDGSNYVVDVIRVTAFSPSEECGLSIIRYNTLIGPWELKTTWELRTRHSPTYIVPFTDILPYNTSRVLVDQDSRIVVTRSVLGKDGGITINKPADPISLMCFATLFSSDKVVRFSSDHLRNTVINTIDEELSRMLTLAQPQPL